MTKQEMVRNARELNWMYMGLRHKSPHAVVGMRRKRDNWIKQARALELADATTVQQVPAQSVYTLELAVGADVASKEYMDYTRAKAAYDLVVHDTQHGWHEVTRIELFSEAVGSMDKWERGQ